MDPDAMIEMILWAIMDGDVITARERMKDLETWIINGGYVPANYHMIIERMESFELETAELITALDHDPWGV